VKVWYRSSSQAVESTVVTVTREDAKDEETLKRKLREVANLAERNTKRRKQTSSDSSTEDSDGDTSSLESKGLVDSEQPIDDELVTNQEGDISSIHDPNYIFTHWEATKKPLSIFLSASLISRILRKTRKTSIRVGSTRFALSGKLSKPGANCVVYCATLNSTECALKVQFVRGMQQEIWALQTLAGLGGVPTLVFHAQFGPSSYLATTPVGICLLDVYWSLSASTIIDILLHVCETLKETHNAGVVHGDISPDNIILKNAGSCEPFLIDWGQAQPIGKTAQPGGKKGYRPAKYRSGEEIVCEPSDDFEGLIRTCHALLHKPISDDDATRVTRCYTSCVQYLRCLRSGST